MATYKTAVRLVPSAASRCSSTSLRSAFAPPFRPNGVLFTSSPLRHASPSVGISRNRHATTAATPRLQAPPQYSPKEVIIFNKLRDALKPTKLFVEDISGGCGSMYALTIVAEQFRGLPVIKQHRLVNSALAQEMKEWHGVQLKTRAPEVDGPSKV